MVCFNVGQWLERLPAACRQQLSSRQVRCLSLLFCTLSHEGPRMSYALKIVLGLSLSFLFTHLSFCLPNRS